MKKLEKALKNFDASKKIELKEMKKLLGGMSDPSQCAETNTNPGSNGKTNDDCALDPSPKPILGIM